MYIEATIYDENDSPIYIEGEVSIQVGTKGSGPYENSSPDLVSTNLISAKDEEGNVLNLSPDKVDKALQALEEAIYDY